MDETQDIALHHQYIAEIFSELVEEGLLVSAYSTAPEKLDTAEIPAQYTLTGSANETNEFGEREEYVVRVYRVQVSVIPTGQANPTEREQLGRELLERCRKQLKRFTQLNDCPRVYEHRVLGDSGIVILPEFGMKYVGFEIRLEVTYSELIDFADNN